MRIVVADDRQAVRSALRLRLEQEPGLDVIGEAEDSATLWHIMTREMPDVLLLDWELQPDRALLTQLLRAYPLLRVVGMSSRPEARAAALAAGAIDFVSKGAPPEHLLHAIRHAGRNSLDEQ